MVHIKITKGLDIPMKGRPPTSLDSPILTMKEPSQTALNLTSFDDLKFKLLVNVGDSVKTGQPLAEDKACLGRMFVSPSTGTIKEIRRGLKRSLQSIIIDVSQSNEHIQFPTIDPLSTSKEALISRLLEGGAFTFIYTRPFSMLANPKQSPRNIFVKALESAPCVPSAEMQVAGLEKEFQTGLDALTRLTDEKVHLVHHKDTTCNAFKNALRVEKHTAEGPHPISNSSVHIQAIDPIRNVDDNVWVLSALDVTAIGFLLLHGRCLNHRVISICGPGVLADRIGYYRVNNGMPITSLIEGRLGKTESRLVSGDPLMGKKVASDEFLGFEHTAFCVIPENTKRPFLHFLGLGLNKYSFSRAYVSGHLNNNEREYEFTTSQHGEHRAFIDSTLYDKVMPLPVPTMLLVKAVMSEDYELAETLGLLQVDDEDFALPTFVCPSKMEMTTIIKSGLRQYAKEVLA